MTNRLQTLITNRLEELIPSFYIQVRTKILYLHSFNQEESEQAVKDFVIKSLYLMILLLVVCLFMISFGQMNLTLIMATIGLPGMIPFLKLRQLDRQITARKRLIIMELPIFLNKLTLLVNAGETVQMAIVRCARRYDQIDDQPFAKEMVQISKQLSNLYPLSQVLDEFNRRCGVQEVSMFTSVVLMNYKRGGDEFVASLRQHSHELWEKRKVMVKLLGEEASGRMVFPLLIVFLVVMIIVGAPAIMLMG